MKEQTDDKQENTKQEQEQEHKSILPSIAESERFIQFLNNKFNLGLRNDLLILIHEMRGLKK